MFKQVITAGGSELVELTPEEEAEFRQTQAEAVSVPMVVSALQAQAALMQVGLLDQIEAHMLLPETDPLMKLAWRKAQEFRRDSQFVGAIAALFNLTSKQVDDLFILAATFQF